MNSLCRKTQTNDRTAAFALTVLAAIILIAEITSPAQAQTFPVAFPAPTTFALDCIGCGYDPVSSVAVADINRDGKLDVVEIGNFQGVGQRLNVELGNGDGTFQAPITTTVTLSNTVFDAGAVGDFNGDGLLDVAAWAVNGSGTEVVILLGNGAGSFTLGNTYTAPSSNNFNPGPSSIVATDVNGDGKLDLVALTPNNGVYIFLGNGDGTFQTPTNYPLTVVSSPAYAVAVADLNGDGKPDLAINVNSGLGVLLNNGNGTFAAAVYYAGPGATANPGIAVGDVNGDKKPDVVVTSNLGDVVLFLNAGSGTFTLKGTVGSTGVGTQFVTLADINGDKKLDIVVADALGEIWTFYGKNNGTFTNGPGYPLQASSVPYGMILADFNGDGALDLLQQDASQPLALAVLGRGDGTFQTNPFYGHATTNSGNNIVTADFNGDGIPDIAYSNVQPPAENRTDFAVMLGSSHGALANPTYVAAVAAPCLNAVEWIASGDVNADGKADIVATLKFYGLGGCPNDTVAVFTGLGTGKFKKPVYYSTGSTAQEGEVFLADVNGDGELDIITSNADGTISVLLNKGNGTYNAGTLTTSMTAINAADNQLAFGDFNRDGKTDIAVTTGGNLGAVYVLPGKGDGTFGTPVQTTTPYFPGPAAVADFNKDGKADLLVTTNGGCSGVSDDGRGYAFLKGNGNGTFTPGPVNCVNGAFADYPVVADFNGDGKPDAFIPYAASTISGLGDAGPTILQGNGDGTFTQLAGPFYVGPQSQQAAVADFNGDGMPDVAVMDNDGNGLNFVTVMQNSTQPVSVSPLNVNYGSVTVGGKKPETVILTNNQKTSLAITSVTVGGTDAGDFSAKSTCGTSRKAGWDCTITVTFTPTVTGARTATLSIKDAVGTQTVQLKGTGK